MREAVLLVLALSLAGGCTGPQEKKDGPKWAGEIEEKTDTGSKAGEAKSPDAVEEKVEAKTQLDCSQMGKRISCSVGEEGGVLLLWPRIIPASEDPQIKALAGRLQARLNAAVKRVAPRKPIDVRPEPERVCPQSGCKANSVGVLLVHQDKGCAAVALLGEPGQSPVTMVPWGGRVDLKTPEIAFRDYPESHVIIRDFAPCDKLIDALFAKESALEEALRARIGARP